MFSHITGKNWAGLTTITGLIRAQTVSLALVCPPPSLGTAGLPRCWLPSQMDFPSEQVSFTCSLHLSMFKSSGEKKELASLLAQITTLELSFIDSSWPDYRSCPVLESVMVAKG